MYMYRINHYTIMNQLPIDLGRLKGGGNRGIAPPPWLTRIKKNISKDRMKIKENLKTCALKKFYIKKDHNKSKTRAIK